MDRLEQDLEMFVMQVALHERIDKLEAALAEKDKQYNDLMAQTVKFADYVSFHAFTDSPSQLDAKAFLTSPAVQAWRAREKTERDEREMQP